MTGQPPSSPPDHARQDAEAQVPSPRTVQPALHARVVPSFVVAALSQPLDSHLGPLQPTELLCWRRPSDLSETARASLRKLAVARSRHHAERLWSTAIGVALPESWPEVLAQDERARMRLALERVGEQPFAELSLREIKQALKLPLEATLAILAKLEAVAWVPPPAPRAVTALMARVPQALPAHEMTPQLRELADAVLRLRWLDGVAPDDLRFAHVAPGGLRKWLEGQVALPALEDRVVELMHALLAADAMSAADEARHILQHAAQQCTARCEEAHLARWVAIAFARLMSPQGAGRKLEDVGQQHGLTRERVRQICQKLLDALAGQAVAAPALERALAATARIAPCSVEEANVQLARFIGADAGIEALLQWAAVLQRPGVEVVCRRTQACVRGGRAVVAMIERVGSAEWVLPLMRHASRDCSLLACSNVLRVAGMLALREGLAPGQEVIESALESLEGFRWLDRRSGWFALGDGAASAVASRVRKMMAVAHESMGTDEIAEALAGDDMMLYRETQSLGLATPPVHVLRELMRPWPWLQLVQQGRFSPSASFDATGVLTGVEALAVNVIEGRGGVACRFELKEALMSELGISHVLVSVVLGSSPVFQRVEFGLYKLVGRRVAPGALEAARERALTRASKAGASVGVSASVFALQVTETTLQREQYVVPTRFRSSLYGQQRTVRDEDGAVLGEAKINNSGTLTGINRLLRPRAGDTLRVEVLDNVLCVRVIAPSQSVDAPAASDAGRPEGEASAAAIAPEDHTSKFNEP